MTLDILFPFQFHLDYSKIVYDKNDKILSTYLNKDDKWRFETNTNEVSDYFKKAIIAKEDKYFYYHPGFNPIAISRAAFQNISSGKVVSGASTITMQVARLLEPKKRNFKNKLIELFRAIQLEVHYTKDEILKMYLNLIPFGSNIEGIQAVSLFYLGKDCKNLSLGEALALTSIPNNPNKYNISKKKDLIVQKRGELIDLINAEKIFGKKEINSAKKEKFKTSRNKAKRTAPQFCLRMIRENPELNNIYTNLDFNHQKIIQELVRNYTQSLQRNRIHNASVLVINNKSSEVLSYIASNDFEDKKNNGEIDGIIALRSPGSTLKPLIYANAFHEGLITPKIKLPDYNIDYEIYVPTNFDKEKMGLVSAEDALIRSLNIPAVYLMDKVGKDKIINQLIDLNFDWLERNKEKIGLSGALGGLGTSVEEMAGLYKTLANYGNYERIKYLRSENLELRNEKLELDSASIEITKESCRN